jgi:hypothetical protein
MLHAVGSLGGIALLIASVTVWPLWWGLAFPFVHAVPGLIGHRLFERNLSLGDVRMFDGDYPGLWFMAANHLRLIQMVWNAVTLRCLFK